MGLLKPFSKVYLFFLILLNECVYLKFGIYDAVFSVINILHCLLILQVFSIRMIACGKTTKKMCERIGQFSPSARAKIPASR